jgi:hypothetical protein
MCILQLTGKWIYIQEPGAGIDGLYLHKGRPTVARLSNIILIIYCPSCRKRCKNMWPVISGMSYCGTPAVSIKI